MYTRPQKLIAEFIGTFLLVFISIGAICADQFLRAGGPAVMGLAGIAIAQGLAYAILITSLAHISGGHLNPAVTIGFWVTRKLSTFETLSYWAAQLVGACTAAYLVRFLFPEDVWRAVALGTPQLAHDFTPAAGMIAEGALTFILVFVFFATAVDPRGTFHHIAGFAAGLTVTLGVLVGEPITGAAMNPARAFGPALASHHWVQHGVYWAGPLAGGVIAAWLYDTLFLKKD
ncbi:MAG TPA: aquaporin [Candidatus Acidoferrales bacterium]|nr:aquaporin [Candidatus Acidoferrales bacterium]